MPFEEKLKFLVETYALTLAYVVDINPNSENRFVEIEEYKKCLSDVATSIKSELHFLEAGKEDIRMFTHQELEGLFIDCAIFDIPEQNGYILAHIKLDKTLPSQITYGTQVLKTDMSPLYQDIRYKLSPKLANAYLKNNSKNGVILEIGALDPGIIIPKTEEFDSVRDGSWGKKNEHGYTNFIITGKGYYQKELGDNEMSIKYRLCNNLSRIHRLEFPLEILGTGEVSEFFRFWDVSDF